MNVVMIIKSITQEQNQEYDEPIPDYAEILTVEEFKLACEAGAYIDYDGYGYAIKNGFMNTNIWIYPSKLDEIPLDASHICWFNK